MKSLDTRLKPINSTKSIQICDLPEDYVKISPNVTDLRACTEHQIQSITDKSTGITPLEEDALDDGFLLCDLSVVRRKLQAWHVMFPRIKPFYALKCNPNPMVAAVLGQDPNCGFDCASISEIRLALLSTGNNAHRCIYANPQRAEADLEAALALGVNALTFDGEEELQKIKYAYERRLQLCRENNCNQGMAEEIEPPEMILRLLVPDGSSTVPLGEKFGAPPDKIKHLVLVALELELPLIGVSFHCGSGCHDPDAYGTAIRIAKDSLELMNATIDEWSLRNDNTTCYPKCTLIDIGGGYPGMDGIGGDFKRFSSSLETTLEEKQMDRVGYLESDETTFKISQVLRPLIDDLFPEDNFDVEIISEPGRYFVEAAFAYCARIYSSSVEINCDENSSRHYYISQGVQGLFKDAILCGEEFKPIPIQIGNPLKKNSIHDTRSQVVPESDEDDPVLYKSIVHGPSGEEFDVVCKGCLLPELEVGDWLVFDRMGAYTLSIAARNSNLPIRYVTS